LGTDHDELPGPFQVSLPADKIYKKFFSPLNFRKIPPKHPGKPEYRNIKSQI